MNDCDALLRAVAEEIRRLGIPLSTEVEPHVEIDSRSATRFGCCRRQGERYTIQVAKRVAEGPERSCREVLAHELLHTCPGCQNHGADWKKYARLVNEAYGYHISRTSTREALQVGEARPCRYLVRCDKCGAEFPRFRASSLTQHPERYRCRCGGKLIRVR